MKDGQSFEAYMLRLADCLPVAEREKYQWLMPKCCYLMGVGNE